VNRSGAGKKVREMGKIGITFQPDSYGGFIAAVSIEDIINISENMDDLLIQASKIYSLSIRRMRMILKEKEEKRKSSRRVPAVLVWDLGDAVIRLVKRLSLNNLELEDLYGHLVRDLKISKSTIAKAIILRRYILERKLLPPTLNWGAFSNSPKRFALKLVNDKK